MAKDKTKESPAEVKPLELASKDKLTAEVTPPAQDSKIAVSPEVSSDPEIDAKAQQFVEQLLSTSLDPGKKREAVDNLGSRTSEKTRHYSAMLREPIKKLQQSAAGEGGPIAKTLVDLTVKVEELDPIQITKVGAFSRLMGLIPGVGKPMKRYFMKYESAQVVIDRIMTSLDVGKTQLLTDNKILSGDQTRMRDITHHMHKIIAMGQKMDELLSAKLDAGDMDENEAKFIETELLFPLRQKVQDLYQKLLVNQQGFIAIEIIIRNNRELIRGVERAKDVTITALTVAVTVAFALNHQKIVLDKISALNVTTDNLLQRTTDMLATQGVDIQKQASTTMLNMEKLTQNFSTLKGAVKELSEFRTKALPEMANAIIAMDSLASEAEKEIQDMEKGDAAQEASLIFDMDFEESTG
ncbi:toxic anion resistance protein [candidate division KSB1 bacterium]